MGLISATKGCSVVFGFGKDQRKEKVKDEVYLFMRYEVAVEVGFCK